MFIDQSAGELSKETKSALAKLARHVIKSRPHYLFGEKYGFVRTNEGIVIFYKGEKPEKFLAKPSITHTSPVSDPKVWGPPLWKEIFDSVESLPSAYARLDFALRIVLKVPCGECKFHWKKWIKENPPEVDTPVLYYLWLVSAKNAVNLRLGKPQFIP